MSRIVDGGYPWIFLCFFCDRADLCYELVNLCTHLVEMTYFHVFWSLRGRIPWVTLRSLLGQSVPGRAVLCEQWLAEGTPWLPAWIVLCLATLMPGCHSVCYFGDG